MPIRFRCPSCQQVLSVTNRKAGQEVRCPSCQSTLKVPKATADVELEPDPVAAPVAAEVAGPEPAEPSPEAIPGTTGAPMHSLAGAFAVGQSTATGEDEEEFALRRPQTEFEDMDLTPMVDVTFLLLIFFMITASFSLQKAISFPPPNADEQGAAAEPKELEDFQDQSVIVEIHEDNSISIDYDKIPLDADLPELLKQKMVSDGKTEMLIDAHERAMHETVVRVVDAGNDVQMQRIRLGSRGGG